MRLLTRHAAFALVSALTLACGGTTIPTAAPATVQPPGSAAPSTPTSAEPTPTNTDVAVLAGIPTSCWGLGPVDCRRVVEELQFELTPDDPLVSYVQVGPFGCEGVEHCPKTLAARPHGGATLDAGSVQLLFEIMAVPGDADLMIDRRGPVTSPFEATSRPPLIAGAQSFELGHCGLWSGIDLGGNWWDPVGLVDSDHPDAINSAKGTIVVIDPNHATFVSQGGLTVQLLRRNGVKFLPGCA
jgi:hypothetical protein